VHSTILKILLPTVLLGGLILSGCTQKDTAVGSGLAPGLNDLYPQEKIIYPEATAFYQVLSTTGTSPYLYLGKAQGYSSDALVRFSPDSSVLPDSFAVDSLKVRLFLDSVVTTGTEPLPVAVHFVNRAQEWTEIGATWNTLDSLELDGSFTTFEIAATLPEDSSYSFALPDSILEAWEWVGNGDKTLHFNNGLLLMAQGDGDHLVRLRSSEHAGISKRPQLEMYLTIFDSTDSLGATAVDTMLVLYATADAFLAQDSTELDTSYLYLGNGAAYRSLFRFDLEDAFDTFGTGLHRAELVLHADTTHPLKFDQITSAFYLTMEDTSWLVDPAAAPIAPNNFPVFAPYDAENGVLTLTMTAQVADWIAEPETNLGFLVRSSNENHNISRAVFYGTEADSSLRPYLRVVYLENEP